MDLLVNLVWLHVNVKEQFVHLKTWDQFLLSKKVVVYASFLGEGASGQEADEEVGGAQGLLLGAHNLPTRRQGW